MLFHIRCKDKTSQMNMRASTRATHLNYVSTFGDSILFAGPTYTDEGETVTGSVFIISLPTISDAEEFCKNDPYRKMGLFETVEIEQIKKVFPNDNNKKKPINKHGNYEGTDVGFTSKSFDKT